MSLKTYKWGLPLLAVCAVLLATRPASATVLNWNDTPEGPYSPYNGNANNPNSVDFNGNPTTADNSFFTGDFQLDPASTLSVQGNFQVHVQVSVLLTSISGDGSLPIPLQNNTLTSNLASINSVPTGGATLALFNEQNAGGVGDIGLDGGTPNPVAGLPSLLTRADMTGLNATLVGASGVGLTSNTITINSSGGNIALHTILGDVNVSLGAALTGTASASLANLAFTQTAAGDILSGTGSSVGFLTPAPGAQNASKLYSLVSTSNTGTISGDAALGVNGAASVSVAGIGVGSFPLALANQVTSLSTSFPLPGAVHLLDLNPGYGPSYPHNAPGDDLQTTIGANLEGIPLPLGINSTLVSIVTASGTIATTFGLQMTFSITGTITLGLLASIVANNLAYQLQDTSLSVVAPEPGSIVLLFVGLVGVLPLIARRYLRKK